MPPPKAKEKLTAQAIEWEDGLPLYPQYCFRLSPTINGYCHLRAADIAGLTTRAGFGGQNVFFQLNHPIQWVRIAGIVVAVDEYPGRRIYTVDDSSGVCIECTVDVPKPDLISAVDAGAKRETEKAPKPVVPGDVDVGTVVEIKGGLTTFRGNKQIKILKTTVLRATEQEVAFWDKVREFRASVLEKPWRLTDKEIRRCRKDEERGR